MLAAALSPLGAGAWQSETPPPGRQNPVLREFFRAQYTTLHRDEDSIAPGKFQERFIDKRIDEFLEKIEKKLTHLSQQSEDLSSFRERLLESLGGSEESRFRAELKRTLRETEQEASELRRMLAAVFVDLKSKSDFKPLTEPDPENRHFFSEIQFIRQRISASQQRIRDYLFSSRPTVHIGDLRNQNMLISLYEAMQMARLLEKQL